MKLVLILISLLSSQSIFAVGPNFCKKAIQDSSLSEALQVLEELHQKGYLSLKDDAAIDEYLDKFIFLSDEDKVLVRERILSYYKNANKNINFSLGVPSYPEHRALGFALGFVHNPVSLWKSMGEPPADIVFERFLRERGSQFNKDQILELAAVLRSQLKDPNQSAYIYGSLANGLAKSTSDIDIAWENLQSSDQVEQAIKKKLIEKKSPLHKHALSLSRYDSDDLNLKARISRVIVEVTQSGTFLLLYPPKLSQDAMGNYIATEPLRLRLSEAN